MAEEAGVSQSTVSLVFSGKCAGRVSQATQDHVRSVARQLGYRPNVAAQALRLGSARAVALLVPDITNPFFSRVLRGAQHAAAAAGYTVALVDTERHAEARTFEALRAGPVDGYMLFEIPPPEGLGPDENVVMMESEAPRRPSVRVDAEGGATAAFEHLIELGHRRVGHLAAAFDAPTFHLRGKARLQVLGSAGIDPDSDAAPQATTAISIDAALEAARPLLDAEPTAVFCDDDVIAAGLYLAARERGLVIPRDLSVVGFDDLDFARVLHPPLTTVALDAELLGATAFALLEERLSGRKAPRRVVLPAELLVRESTAPPPAP